MSKHVREVNERDFDQVVLKSKTPVLVDFWAEWCGPCHALAPDVEAAAERYRDGGQVVKVNVDDSPTLAQRYRIQAIPTLILFQDGVEKDRIVGVVSQEQISETIERSSARTWQQQVSDAKRDRQDFYRFNRTSTNRRKPKGGEVMKVVTSFVGSLLLVGSLGTSTAFSAASGVISNEVITAGVYCHLTFPAIREETLGGDRPVLKDPSSGDMVDFYGPCDTDPLGKDQVRKQRLERQHRWWDNYSD